jgi:single-strand DNA-binding protein
MSYTKIFIVGHVGSKPEIRKIANGSTVANFSLATNEKFMRGGTVEEKTHWWRIDAWQKGDTGLVTDVIGKFVNTGSQLMIEGTPVQEEWTDKTTGQKRNGFKIRIGHPGTTMQLCGRPNGNGHAKADEADKAPVTVGGAPGDDEIPF